ncbi:hypothetical protein FB563_7872 [Streptomyces puniciscabiei]|uniref:Uncharacterized protein n=1 Tax=Streptomyces puniciscabiei TaxID=164348 RepID=A0A542SY47_9ACTN|nr:hypothetical protein FB563_7872 [Streptomyces puniciscabiei]
MSAVSCAASRCPPAPSTGTGGRSPACGAVRPAGPRTRRPHGVAREAADEPDAEPGTEELDGRPVLRRSRPPLLEPDLRVGGGTRVSQALSPGPRPQARTAAARACPGGGPDPAAGGGGAALPGGHPGCGRGSSSRRSGEGPPAVVPLLMLHRRPGRPQARTAAARACPGGGPDPAAGGGGAALPGRHPGCGRGSSSRRSGEDPAAVVPLLMLHRRPGRPQARTAAARACPGGGRIRRPVVAVRPCPADTPAAAAAVPRAARARTPRRSSRCSCCTVVPAQACWLLTDRTSPVRYEE